MTIYALSSGPGISGIAVIRISGQETREIITKMTSGSFPKAKKATLKKSVKLNQKRLLIKGLLYGFLPQRATQVKIWLNSMFMVVEQ